MTREEAMQVMARDHVLNPGQGGKYKIRKTSQGDYEALWTDRKRTVWRLSYDGTRMAWGMPPKEALLP